MNNKMLNKFSGKTVRTYSGLPQKVTLHDMFRDKRCKMFEEKT